MHIQPTWHVFEEIEPKSTLTHWARPFVFSYAYSNLFANTGHGYSNTHIRTCTNMMQKNALLLGLPFCHSEKQTNVILVLFTIRRTQLQKKNRKVFATQQNKSFLWLLVLLLWLLFFLLFEVLIVYITSLSMKNSYRHQCNQKNLFLSKLIEIVHSVIFLYNCLIFLSEFFLFLSSTIISRIRCCTLSTSVLINISVPLIGTHPIEKNKREKREIKKKTADFSTSAPNN